MVETVRQPDPPGAAGLAGKREQMAQDVKETDAQGRVYKAEPVEPSKDDDGNADKGVGGPLGDSVKVLTDEEQTEAKEKAMANAPGKLEGPPPPAGETPEETKKRVEAWEKERAEKNAKTHPEEKAKPAPAVPASKK